MIVAELVTVPRFLRNPKLKYRIEHTLRQLNAVHILFLFHSDL